jgi:hypothetical protein
MEISTVMGENHQRPIRTRGWCAALGSITPPILALVLTLGTVILGGCAGSRATGEAPRSPDTAERVPGPTVVQADSTGPTDDALAQADAVSTTRAPSGHTSTLPGRLTPEELAALVAGPPRPIGDGDYLFTLDEPDAGFVSVAGTFNGWIPAQYPLVRRDSLGGEDGLWYGLIALPRGRHLYKYLVDGHRWVTDPANKQVTRDGFGSAASVVVVQ